MVFFLFWSPSGWHPMTTTCTCGTSSWPQRRATGSRHSSNAVHGVGCEGPRAWASTASGWSDWNGPVWCKSADRAGWIPGAALWRAGTEGAPGFASLSCCTAPSASGNVSLSLFKRWTRLSSDPPNSQCHPSRVSLCRTIHTMPCPRARPAGFRAGAGLTRSLRVWASHRRACIQRPESRASANVSISNWSNSPSDNGKE
jgi:hypothetical protein